MEKTPNSCQKYRKAALSLKLYLHLKPLPCVKQNIKSLPAGTTQTESPTDTSNGGGLWGTNMWGLRKKKIWNSNTPKWAWYWLIFQCSRKKLPAQVSWKLDLVLSNLGDPWLGHFNPSYNNSVTFTEQAVYGLFFTVHIYTSRDRWGAWLTAIII